MARQGGGFGIVMLVVVVAVVLLLAARQWESVAPTALEVANPNAEGPEEALREGKLPGLNDMRQTTDAHAQAVQDAMAEIE